jgi:hypothetical protein
MVLTSEYYKSQEKLLRFLNTHISAFCCLYYCKWKLISEVVNTFGLPLTRISATGVARNATNKIWTTCNMVRALACMCVYVGWGYDEVVSSFIAECRMLG